MLLWKSVYRALWVANACGFMGLAGLFAVDALAVEPGKYLYVDSGHAHGALLVKGKRFTLDTIGSNCHTCSLTGTLNGNVGVASDGSGTCRISIIGDRGTLKVDSGGAAACRSYCGARAMFDGEYRKPAAVCTDRSRVAQVTLARAQYVKKNYAAAEVTFTTVLRECESARVIWTGSRSIPCAAISR